MVDLPGRHPGQRLEAHHPHGGGRQRGGPSGDGTDALLVRCPLDHHDQRVIHIHAEAGQARVLQRSLHTCQVDPQAQHLDEAGRPTHHLEKPVGPQPSEVAGA